MAINLRFITGIRWSKTLLEALNNMTFMYDPSWKASNSVKATFPVCFFHVKGQHEVMSSEISQKQMLFYNSSVGEDGDNSGDPSLDSGLLNVVADNIVIKPKVYKLDVVIPYQKLTLLDQSFVFNTQTLQAVNEVLINNNHNKAENKTLASYATLSQPLFTFIKGLLKSMLLTNTFTDSSVQDFILGVAKQPDYNKESLETMWRMRHIVKMKMWNSWKYKYLGIVDMDITKEGTEDGVYEATLTVQEMPIITMYAQGVNKRANFTWKNPLLEARGKNIVAMLNKAGDELL